MDISTLSSSLNRAPVMDQIALRVAKLGLDSVKETMDSQLRMIEKSVNPHLGTKIDFKV